MSLNTLPTGKPLHVELAGVANLPTRFGEFRIHVFTNSVDDKEHIAMVRGDVFNQTHVPVRIHSECLTGDVMGSLRCDCREQFEKAMTKLGSMQRGVLLYLRQEGRGIGLINKIRAYKLQEQGLDTVEANHALGFRDDERDYAIAAAMLRLLGVRSVGLFTNNPEKIRQVTEHGVPVIERFAHEIEPNAHNAKYLATKAKKSGHMLSIS